MKIVVLGAGAVGSFLAGRLAHAGRDVAILARGPHLDAIRADGLTVETPDERLTVHLEATDDAAALPTADLLIVTAKTPALPAILEAVLPHQRGDVPVLHAVNGVFWWYAQGFAPAGITPDTHRLDPQGRLAALLPPERAMGMVIYSPNEIEEPGRVRNGRFDNRFVIGSCLSGSQDEQAIARALSGCGFTIEIAREIRHAMWQKLLANLSSAPIAALTGSRSSELVEHPSIREIIRGILREAIAVAAAHGIADLGIDPQKAAEPGNKPRHKPSMLQDLERGRPMEIDSMLRIVQDFADQAAIATPTLDVLLALLIQRARVAGCYPSV